MCGTNPYAVTLFQNHARLCDPFYEDRLQQSRPIPPPPPPPTPPVLATAPELSQDPLYQISFTFPQQTQNLLDYYVPPSESTYKGCWTGDSRIFKSDGSLITVSDIIPGDLLLGVDGKATEVEAVIVTSLPNVPDSRVKIVQLSPYCAVTSGHPVFNPARGVYVRADTLKPSSPRRIEKLFNFELKGSCEGVMCEGGVVAATVGKSFDQVKEFSPENDKVWGDDYWTTTKDLLKNNFFPNIKYYSLSS